MKWKPPSEPVEIGSYRVHFPLDGHFRLDGGAMFGVIPKPLWSRSVEVDDRNRIELAARPMLLRDGDRTILVDTGIGRRWNQKESDIYAVRTVSDGIRGSLDQLGLAPGDITDVIFTHLHFDHAGATTYRDADGELSLTFPRANYYIQADGWEWANQPTERDRASFRKDDFVLLSGNDQLTYLENSQELFPGITCDRVDGHTEGLQMVRVEGSDSTLVYVTDLIPTTAHLPPAYVMGYDLWPLETLQQRKRLLPKAVENEYFLAFEHDPETVVATIRREDDEYRLDREILGGTSIYPEEE